MNIGDQIKRFRKQYNDAEWSKLELNGEFIYAWERENLVRCGEVADIVLNGTAHDLSDARVKVTYMRMYGEKPPEISI